MVSCKQDQTPWAGALHAQQSMVRGANLDTVHKTCQGRTLSPFGGVLSKIYQTNPKWEIFHNISDQYFENVMVVKKIRLKNCYILQATKDT